MHGLICTAVQSIPGKQLNDHLLDGKKKETLKGLGLIPNDITSSSMTDAFREGYSIFCFHHLYSFYVLEQKISMSSTYKLLSVAASIIRLKSSLGTLGD